MTAGNQRSRGSLPESGDRPAFHPQSHLSGGYQNPQAADCPDRGHAAHQLRLRKSCHYAVSYRAGKCTPHQLLRQCLITRCFFCGLPFPARCTCILMSPGIRYPPCRSTISQPAGILSAGTRPVILSPSVRTQTLPSPSYSGCRPGSSHLCMRIFSYCLPPAVLNIVIFFSPDRLPADNRSLSLL